MAHTNVGGLSLKYSEPKAFYLVVVVSREKYFPEIMKRASITEIAKRYLLERMLACTGGANIVVVDDPHDKRLVEDDVLVAYVKVDYYHSISESNNAPTAMVRSGYVRTDVYLRSQFYDERIAFIPLDGDETALKELVRKRVISTLRPTFRYNVHIDPQYNPDLKVLKQK